MRRDRRFTGIAVLSVISHVLFYALMIKIAVWTVDYSKHRRGGGLGLVQIAELAPPPKREPLRSPVRPRERVDLTRFEYDPENSDDTNIVERSRKLGDPRGSSRSSSSPKPAASIKSSNPPLSPPITHIETSRIPPINLPSIAQTSAVEPAPSPPDPQKNQKKASAEGGRDWPLRTGPAATSLGTRELGLDEVKAQYRAYVRQKIWQVNERNKPKDWIRDTLSQRASTDFLLTIGRSGDVVSLTMTRPSGYSVLDRAAREAILLARPFDGFPQNAGDVITFNVEVKYEPIFR
jgi:periplasmic protein TonB